MIHDFVCAAFFLFNICALITSIWKRQYVYQIYMLMSSGITLAIIELTNPALTYGRIGTFFYLGFTLFLTVASIVSTAISDSD